MALRLSRKCSNITYGAAVPERATPVSELLESLLGLLSFFSPPFLIALIWRNFLKHSENPLPVWKALLHWVSIVSVSSFFAVCLTALLTVPCDVATFGWGCVARWQSFTGIVVRSTPLFILLGALGRNRTRILSMLLVIAVGFDCVMIDIAA